MKKLSITLHIEARAFTHIELCDAGADPEIDEGGDDDELYLDGIGFAIASMFHEGSEAVEEAFAGSNLFVHLGDAELIHIGEAEA